MNILILSNLYPRPHDPSYGIFIHRQVMGLQRLGHQVTVISPVPWAPKILHFNAKWRSYGLAPDQVNWEGVKIYYPRFLRIPGAWFRALAGLIIYLSTRSIVEHLHKNRPFDVIYSNILLPDGLAGVYLGQKFNLPTICMVRGSDIITAPYENFINRHFSKTVICRTKQIVAVSQALKQLIEHLVKPAKPVQVVYNGVDAEKFKTLEMKKEFASLQPYLLFVGRDIRRKGLKDLINAFFHITDKIEHNLVVIGPTQDEVWELEPEKTNLLGNRLIVAGVLAPNEIPDYMANCEALILPSYSEGLPNVVLEAMACAKPVIATNVMGTPEAVIESVTGILVPPGDPVNLAEAIYALVNDPDSACKMGAQGRQRVVNEFSWTRNAAKMISIYQKASQ